MFRNPPPTITGLGPQSRRLPPSPIQGLQDTFTDPWNLESAGVDTARDYYRNQNDQDVHNGGGVSQAVHMAQAAQATTPDPMGFKGLMHALSERDAVIPRRGGGLDLPDAPTSQPSTIFDPARQTSAVDHEGVVMNRSALDKINNPQYYGGVQDNRRPSNPALNALKRSF